MSIAGFDRVVLLGTLFFGCGCRKPDLAHLENAYGFPPLSHCTVETATEAEVGEAFDVFVRVSSTDPDTTIYELETLLRGDLYPTEQLPPAFINEAPPPFFRTGRELFYRRSTKIGYQTGLVCRRTENRLTFWFFRRHSSK